MNQKSTPSIETKRILITGGTGSIGSEVLDSLVKMKPKQIVIFSRDEYKQHKLRYKYANEANIEYILGDIRDLDSLMTATIDIDILFHAAALKHVPFSEVMPEEFIKTNILGSINVKKAAISNNIPLVVSISTDKAINPSNVMGLTKAVQEKVFISNNLNNNKTNTSFINVRFGNVIGTHGSLFPILLHQIENKQTITLTDPRMTRFFMSAKEAVSLILWATLNGRDGDIVIKKMKATHITDVIDTFYAELGLEDQKQIKEIGIRVGEKLDEYLISEDELSRLEEKDGYFIVHPYSLDKIKENLAPQDGTVNNIDMFSSKYRKNIMSDTDLKLYINDFMKQHKANNDYI